MWTPLTARHHSAEKHPNHYIDGLRSNCSGHLSLTLSGQQETK
jgi:hypothetical protein